MKNLFAIFVFATNLNFAPVAFAGEDSSCHFHGSKPAAESTIIGCANQRRDALVKSGKLSAAWTAIKHEQLALVDGQKGKEWKISYKDTAAQDKTKENLYMFFTQTGNFIAANHSGK
jgi:Family of unknown function (DUF6488)